MSGFNLPPGVSLSDVDPSDTWEKLFEVIQDDCDKAGMADLDCLVAWRIGLAAWKRAHELGAKFPHE